MDKNKVIENLKKDIGLSEVLTYEEREGIVIVTYLDTDNIERSVTLVKNEDCKTLLMTALG